MSNIQVTEKAVTEINRIKAEQNLLDEEGYLRIKIQGGGCSGFSTKLDLDEHSDEKTDEVIDLGNVKVVIDKRSYLYLQAGVDIDYIDDDLMRRGFKVDIKGSKGTCGCGSSFSM